ncbi:MAG TPA: glutamate formimidoyltransferase [bacterium]|nr:glutamate formimidoyltransferase [bacterium]
MNRIVECVPNFSEGRDRAIIDQITAEIKKVKGVKLLDVDPGWDTNRTVVTMVGEPEPVIEAAFNAVKKAHELIDMRKHKGAHPRFGACDVCPVIPVSGVTMEECVEIAHRLGKKLGEELDYPVYFYEYAATTPERKNLAKVREGEYEGLEARLKDPHWKPDTGPAVFRPTKGATAVSAREFLIAYNVNLNTVDKKKANDLALLIREQGYPKRDAKGTLVKGEKGEKIMVPGKFKSCKAIGWYVDDYKRAQISINLTNYKVTSMHQVFDELSERARDVGLRVTGSEIVGVVPKQALVEAGTHYLEKQGGCAGQSDEELIKIAAQSLGLSDVAPFKPQEKVIEYLIREQKGLVDLTVSGFCDLLASDAPAPGGGSVAALCGAMAASLASMVANLTHGKKGYTQHNALMNDTAKEAQTRKAELLMLIDEDTLAFNRMMAAMSVKKKAEKEGSDEEKKRATAEEYEALKYGTLVPLKCLERSGALCGLLAAVAEKGNEHAVSDAGVGAHLVKAAAHAAALNVRINLKNFADTDSFKGDTLTQMKKLLAAAEHDADAVIATVDKKL